MTWALLLVIGVFVVIMSLNGRGQVPWGNKMRRIHAGVARKAEWMAPDEVVAQVRSDYLSASRWQQDNMLSGWQPQWSTAPLYLSGPFLKRFQTILMQHRSARGPRVVGVLRADHHISIRCFSEDGEHCLVVDEQSQRRMATYDVRTQSRVLTQDLGDGAVVYGMAYDSVDRRWKISEFVQELPVGWARLRSSSRIRELSAIPTTVGRDN